MKITLPSQKRLIYSLGSARFFKLIIGLLIVEASWIALSGRYPMAFDEDFHLGIIRLYAHHLHPFWAAQPLGGDAFGAVNRDPSYLYHYLMSFPYHLLTLITHNQSVQVIAMRAINIGMFASGLVLYRKLLLKTRAAPALVNLCLLIFVLIPITPLLAAQINYDNLVLPLTAGALLLSLRLIKGLTKRSIDVKTLLQLTILCLLSSLVKYAFLPICLAIVVYLLIRASRVYNRSPKALLAALKAGWRPLQRWTRWGLVLGVLLSGGLFVERYGVNLVRYHTPVADCAEVLNYEHCQYYGPWLRDYDFKVSKGQVGHSPVSYTQHWIYGMWLRSFFAVDGPTTQYQTRGPLAIPAVSAAVLASLSGLALVVTARRLWRRYNSKVLWLFVAVILAHTLILWLEEYRLFTETGQPVAINGRYLLPILPLVLLLAALAVNELLKNRIRLKLAVATAVIICFAWGGGALTYILRSNDSWYWSTGTVRTANHAVQRTLGPITPGYHFPVEFLH